MDIKCMGKRGKGTAKREEERGRGKGNKKGGKKSEASIFLWFLVVG
jgi:hypothetical protein